jgi:hypothetical protein
VAIRLSDSGCLLFPDGDAGEVGVGIGMGEGGADGEGGGAAISIDTGVTVSAMVGSNGTAAS